ncbi:MAG: hypothetical protein ACO1SX_12540 [Actinomycetota bacterium]
MSFPAAETVYPVDAPKPAPLPVTAKTHEEPTPDLAPAPSATEPAAEPLRQAEAELDVPVVEPEALPAQPVVRKLVPERSASATPVAPADRPQPVTVPTSGRPATELRATEPTATSPMAAMAKEGIMAMPGEPLTTGGSPLAPQDPVMPIDKDPTRMAGMAVEVETPGEEDEGLRTFRMFLLENSRTVPQPPTVRPRERGRKSL